MANILPIIATVAIVLIAGIVVDNMVGPHLISGGHTDAKDSGTTSNPPADTGKPGNNSGNASDENNHPTVEQPPAKLSYNQLYSSITKEADTARGDNYVADADKKEDISIEGINEDEKVYLLVPEDVDKLAAAVWDNEVSHTSNLNKFVEVFGAMGKQNNLATTLKGENIDGVYLLKYDAEDRKFNKYTLNSDGNFVEGNVPSKVYTLNKIDFSD